MLSSDVKALFQHSVHADVARTAAVRQILLVRQCNVGSNPTHTTHNNVAVLCHSTIYEPLKLHSNGPLYSNTVIGTLAIDGWTVTFGTARKDLGGLWPRPVCSLQIWLKGIFVTYFSFLWPWPSLVTPKFTISCHCSTDHLFSMHQTRFIHKCGNRHTDRLIAEYYPSGQSRHKILKMYIWLYFCKFYIFCIYSSTSATDPRISLSVIQTVTINSSVL